MRQSIKELVKIITETLPISEPIYEFGALQTPGQEGFADLRPLFAGKKYIGCDMREGPGVDRILNLHNIDLPAESVGTALLLETLEHVEFPWKVMGDIYKILKPNGFILISSVMNFPIHNYPPDYYRFTPEAFRSLLKPFAATFVGFAGEEKFPHTVIGLGFKSTPSGTLPPGFMTAFAIWRKIWETSNDDIPRIISSALTRSDGNFKLDLGCGKFKKDGFIGLDIERNEKTDLVYDLNKGIPFPDNTVSHIFCSHFLEHVQNPLYLLQEIHRVCVSDALIEIIVPLDEEKPGHVTIFDEDWFNRNLDPNDFSILANQIAEKSGVSPDGKLHSWIQQEINLGVIKSSLLPPLAECLSLRKEKGSLQLELRLKESQMGNLQQELSDIKNSAGYRLVSKYYWCKEKLLPFGSARRTIYQRFSRLLKRRLFKNIS